MTATASPTKVGESVIISTPWRRAPWLDFALILLALAAFARVAWGLGAEDLWWDESLTLQRAESALLPLLRNDIVLADGVSQLVSTDQHPFFYFLLQGLLLRLAGDDEYVLRFVSAAAATLMVPAAYAFAALYARRGVFPRMAPFWAALMATVSPFFLWFGQEARPYALWALLAMLSTYALLRTDEPHRSEDARVAAVRWPWIAGYVATLVMFLTSHYYAVFLLPVHAVLIYQALRARSRALAAVVGIAVAAAGVALIGAAYWFVVQRQNAGDNFSHIDLEILLPDLLNAFSLGLSVDISRVLWIDVLFGLMALAASGWALRSRNTWAADGWVPVAMVAVPISAVVAGDNFQPMYMTARHLSLIGGPFIVLVGAGLGLVWTVRPWLSILAALILVTASGFSVNNYFTQEAYAQDDFSRLASDLDDRLAPGDLVLVKSPFAWRVFAYYQPKATMRSMARPGDTAYGDEVDVYGAPLLNKSWPERYAFLDKITGGHRRIWLLVSGTQAHMDLDGRVEQWLEENLFKVQETVYFSQSSLKSHLFLPEVPVYESVPGSMQNVADAVFGGPSGETVRLHGYDVAYPPHTDLALPLTLYWEAAAPMDRRYKYQVQLVELLDDGSQQVLSTVEQEPYMGAIPTLYWDPGKIIVEYTELPPSLLSAEGWPSIDTPEQAERYRLVVQVYDAETLEKLRVTDAVDFPVTQDGAAVVLPYRPQ